VLEKETGSEDGSMGGRTIAAGTANSLEFRSRVAAGDRRAALIAVMRSVPWISAVIFVESPV
jgi:hypothetical protein